MLLITTVLFSLLFLPGTNVLLGGDYFTLILVIAIKFLIVIGLYLMLRNLIDLFPKLK